MAVQAVTNNGPDLYLRDAGIVTSTWAAMANGDSGTPVQLDAFADRSLQVTGTFGVGGSCTLEGSNDGVNYFALHNPQGTLIAQTAAGLVQILELTLWVRPRVTAGDGTTSLVAVMTAGRTIR